MSRTDQVKPASRPRDRKKPYARPRVVTYGHVKDVVKGALANGNDSGGNRSKNCWVAEALYGIDAPRTLIVRSWLTEMAASTRRWRLFSSVYTLTGRRVASMIRRGRLPRMPFRMLFDALVAKAVARTAARLAERAFPLG